MVHENALNLHSSIQEGEKIQLIKAYVQCAVH